MGRSSHVEHSIPPYFSTLSMVYIPAALTSEFHLILNDGESLCAAMTMKPRKSGFGRRSAIMEEPVRRT